MRLPQKLTEVVDELIQPLDPIQTFLNTYTLCLDHWEASFNLLQEEVREFDYGSKAQAFLTMLRTGSPVQQIRKAIGSADEEEILIGALALLTALARYIAETRSAELYSYSRPYQTSDGFGGIPYWLSLDGPGSFGGAIPVPPRSMNELHANLKHYYDPLHVTPGILGEWTLNRICVDRTLENFFSQRVRDGRFRVAVSPLSYKAEIKGKSERRKPPQPPYAFHLTSIGPPEEQLVALQSTLELATSEGAAVLVLPELRMPPPLLTAAREFLRHQTVDRERGLLLVAAGSWHIEENGRRHNRCVVLNHLGDALWSHDKLREYVISAENVKASPEFFGRIGVGEGGGSEAIHRGRTFEFYDSIIGRIAIAICVGFFSPEIEPLLQASSANVLLVPAMTPSMTALEARAEAVVHTQHAATFVANCGSVSLNANSFYRLPTKLVGRIGRLEPGQPILLFDLSNI